MHNKWLVLVVISAALFLIGIDMTVLYTALPTLTHDLQATNSDKLWIINAYPLVMAGLLLGAGTLGDRVGHRLMFMLGLTVFALASVFAAFAPSSGMLIAGRGMLAVGAAMMMPATLALLRHTFVTEREQGIAMGIWGAVYSGAAAVGPLIGGFLLTHFWWGAVFLINVPVVLLAMIMTPVLIAKTEGNPERKWDFLSSLMVMIGLVGLTYGLKEVVKLDRDWTVFAAAILVGVVFLVLFVVRQRRSTSPLVDFGLFKNPRFRGGVMAIVFSMVVLMGVQLVLTQRLQLVEDLSPLQAGMFMVPISLSSFLAGPIIGSVLFKIGIGRVLWVSLACAGFGLLTFVGVKDGPIWLKVMALAAFGFGSGSAVSSASTSVMVSAPPDKAGMAGSLEAISYELGAVVGVAIMGSITTFLYVTNLMIPADMLDIGAARDGLDQVLMMAEASTMTGMDELVVNAKIAFEEAFVGVITIAAVILLVLSAVLTWTFRKRIGESEVVVTWGH